MNCFENKEAKNNDRMRGSLRVPNNLMNQISLFNRKITNNEYARSDQGQIAQGERIGGYNVVGEVFI